MTRIRFLAIIAAACSILLISPQAQAAVITAPPDVPPGGSFRLVFVTDGHYDSLESTAVFYDGRVMAEATAAGLTTYNGNPVSWQAIVSTVDGTVAIDRLPADAIPIYLLDGTQVAASGSALWETATTDLLAPINLSPSSAANSAPRSGVWTGTSPSGLASMPLGFRVSHIGFSYSMSSAWINASAEQPFEGLALYGFSTVMTRPALVAVPEPASLTIFGLGIILMGAGGLRRRRRSDRDQDRS